jgi:histidine triad (HIT) family protein
VTDSIFTKIIKGQIPSHKVYEDDYTIVIMDIFPIQPGQVLIISKIQTEDFYNLPESNYQNLFKVAKKMATKLKSVFPNKKRIAMQIEGLDVPHVHIKLFPIDSTEEFHSLNSSREPDHQALAEMATKLKLNMIQ